MPKYIKLRAVSASEANAIRRLAHARQGAVEVVRRALLIEYLLDHPEVPASQAGMRVGFGSNPPGSEWVKRFNAQGVAGLENRAKPGHPVTHSKRIRSEVVSFAVQKPRRLGYPLNCGRWNVCR